MAMAPVMKRLTSIVAVSALVVGTLTLGSGAAFAADPTLTVTLSQTTGTAPFSANDDPGNDSGPGNDIVRTNDTVGYKVGVRYEGEDQTNPTISFQLPQGQELQSLPPFCLPGSSVVPASLPAPANPVTSTSWVALPQQTVTCRVADQTAGTSLDYDFIAKVRPEVPNATTLGPVTATATSAEVTEPAVSASVSQVVSAAARFDLSKRGVGTTDTSGPMYEYNVACSFDSSRGCKIINFPITVSAPNGGKGATPLASPISFTEDVSPDVFYGAGTTTSPAWLAAGSDALDRYGARVTGCTTTSFNLRGGLPNSAMASASVNATNSVRQSGSVSCTNMNVPGGVSTVTITGADTSAFTVPTLSQNGTALDASTGYVIALTLNIEVPVEAIADLGAQSGGASTLSTRNTFTDLQASDIAGNPNAPEPLPNNTRAVSLRLETSGSVGKRFAGVTGATGNTPAGTFNPGAGYWEGPPGSSTVGSGNTVVVPGQTVTSNLVMSQDIPVGTGDTFSRTRVTCDTWDLATAAMPVTFDQPDTQVSGPNTFLSYLPSNGAPVWVSGFAVGNTKYPAGSTFPGANIEIQYGYTATPGNGGASACNTGSWYDSIAAVPTAVQEDGVWQGVNRVRYSVNFNQGGQTRVNLAIALKILPDAGVAGTIVPNWMSSFYVSGNRTMAEAVSGSGQTNSTYVPASHTGSQGDRLIIGAVTARVKKFVQNGVDGAFVDSTVPQFTSGDLVKYRLNPTLTADVSAGTTADAVIEDCLPAYQQFLSSERESGAALAPTVIAATSPAGAGLTCGPNETYVMWDLGTVALNSVIDPIIYTVELSDVVRNGLYTNTVRISSEQDPSDPALRSDTAQVQVIAPSGIKIAKTTPQTRVEVNPEGATNPRQLVWRVELSNIDAAAVVSEADVIDVLPANGLGTTRFEGALRFESATPTAASGAIETLFTRTASADLVADPAHSSNATGGATVWCDALTGGAVVSGNGTSAECPDGAEDVTGLRFQRAGAFAPEDEMVIDIVMVPSNNASGDVYQNTTAGRVNGVSQPVGPRAREIAVISGSIGDVVWYDANRNGVQDDGEPRIAGVPVSLLGADTNDNPVSRATTTDANGQYLFDGLPSGAYTVTFDPEWVAEQGYEFTLQAAGGAGDRDSDADPVTGTTGEVALGVEEQRLDLDAGVVRRLTALAIAKVVNDPDPGDGLGDAESYPVTVGCTFPEQDPASEPLEFDLTIAADGTPSEITDLPVGATCTVLETDADGGEASYSVPDGVIVLGSDGNAVTVTNSFPGVLVDKAVVGDVERAENGAFEVTYDITVSNTGQVDTTYDVVDEIRYGDDLTVTGASVTRAPTGVEVSETWDGLTDTVIASGVPIGVGQEDVYRVVVTSLLATTTVTTPKGDLTCEGSDTVTSGSGFVNSAEVRTEIGSSVDAACAEPPAPPSPGAPSSAGLEHTGGQLWPWAGGAGVLLLGGAAALAIQRIRRRRS